MTLLIGAPPLFFTQKATKLVSVSSSTGSGTNITFNRPQNTQVGSSLVMVGYTDAPVTVSSAPAGFTSWLNESGANSTFVYTKTAGASEPATYSFDVTGSADISGVILNYSNVDLTSSQVGNRTRASGATITATSITPGAPGVTLAFFGADTLSSATSAPTTPWSIAFLFGFFPDFILFEKNPSSTSTGNQTMGLGISSQNTGFQFHLRAST